MRKRIPVSTSKTKRKLYSSMDIGTDYVWEQNTNARNKKRKSLEDSSQQNSSKTKYKRSRSSSALTDHNKQHIKTTEDLINIPETEKVTIRNFYQDVIRRFISTDNNTIKNEVQFIVVGHLVPTLPFYLEALGEIGEVAAVVAKGSVPDPDIIQWLNSKKATIKKVITKDNFSENNIPAFESLSENSKLKYEELKKQCSDETNIQYKFGIKEWLMIDPLFFIQQWTTDKKMIIIIDIRGYFANIVEEFIDSRKNNEIKKRIIGIVEDTENGYQKYETIVKRVPNKPQFDLRVVDLRYC